MATPTFSFEKVSDRMHTVNIVTDTGQHVAVDLTQRNGRLRVDVFAPDSLTIERMSVERDTVHVQMQIPQEAQT